ncbi:MAG: hypothetical protein H5T96_09205 [Tissierellales bacterium]|nr:hypothetical protein [Tissierellales bacterium]
MIKIAVTVRGGIVEGVYLSGGNHKAELYLIDWDNIDAGQKDLVIGEEIENVSKERFDELIMEANNEIKEDYE